MLWSQVYYLSSILYRCKHSSFAKRAFSPHRGTFTTRSMTGRPPFGNGRPDLFDAPTISTEHQQAETRTHLQIAHGQSADVAV